jgi:hypothetical protein
VLSFEAVVEGAVEGAVDGVFEGAALLDLPRAAASVPR